MPNGSDRNYPQNELILNDDLFRSFNISQWGYTEDPQPKSFDRFQNWLQQEKHEPLSYLSGERGEKRKNLKSYFPAFESALVFSFSYAKEKKQLESYYEKHKSNFKIASYVLGFKGLDYHHYLKLKLERIGDFLKERDPELEYRLTLDTQPVLERDLAFRSGLGWFGKNSMLIDQKEGSFFIIGSLLLSKKMNVDKASLLETDHCGQCTKCIEACPTDAIDGVKREIISEKCISTYTIEVFKEAIPPEGYSQSNGEIYGCDICQNVCPWNIKLMDSLPSEENAELGKDKVLEFFCSGDSKEEILSKLNVMSNREFRRYFAKTPLERTGRIGLMKNIKNFQP